MYGILCMCSWVCEGGVVLCIEEVRCLCVSSHV